MKNFIVNINKCKLNSFFLWRGSWQKSHRCYESCHCFEERSTIAATSVWGISLSVTWFVWVSCCLFMLLLFFWIFCPVCSCLTVALPFPRSVKNCPWCRPGRERGADLRKRIMQFQLTSSMTYKQGNLSSSHQTCQRWVGIHDGTCTGHSHNREASLVT